MCKSLEIDQNINQKVPLTRFLHTSLGTKACVKTRPNLLSIVLPSHFSLCRDRCEFDFVGRKSIQFPHHLLLNGSDEVVDSFICSTSSPIRSQFSLSSQSSRPVQVWRIASKSIGFGKNDRASKRILEDRPLPNHPAQSADIRLVLCNFLCPVDSSLSRSRHFWQAPERHRSFEVWFEQRH